MSKKSFIISVIIALIAVFVVAAVSTVFVDDSAHRYGTAPSPTESAKDDSVIASVDVKDESTEAIAQNDVGGVNETVTEHMEDASDAVPETVIDEGIADEAVTSDAQRAVVTAEGLQDSASSEPVAEAPSASETSSQTPAAAAKTVIVTAEGLKYAPMVVEIQPGDQVAWENMPTHDTQSLEGLIPEGAEAWHSTLGENYERTFTVEGIYIYKCTPHFGSGMGGAIIVGKPTNLDAIKAADVKGAAKRLVKKAIAAAEAM
ncbi:MAG TPA: copper-binding protein [Methylophaga aminisulfidivorans]|uniref:Copper-binding protein n=2 Tax=root TaxID=1 RepID=A0A7C1VW71_9GAMM|nr:copper-binding protein [Methylophaga aminisulfidivorans]